MVLHMNLYADKRLQCGIRPKSFWNENLTTWKGFFSNLTFYKYIPLCFQIIYISKPHSIFAFLLFLHFYFTKNISFLGVFIILSTTFSQTDETANKENERKKNFLHSYCTNRGMNFNFIASQHHGRLLLGVYGVL